MPMQGDLNTGMEHILFMDDLVGTMVEKVPLEQKYPITTDDNPCIKALPGVFEANEYTYGP
jgi:hypothetical protein